MYRTPILFKKAYNVSIARSNCPFYRLLISDKVEIVNNLRRKYLAEDILLSSYAKVILYGQIPMLVHQKKSDDSEKAARSMFNSSALPLDIERARFFTTKGLYKSAFGRFLFVL